MSRHLTSVALTVVMMSGCMTTDPYTGEQEVSKATTGAAIGAATGAVLAALTTDSSKERRKRALIGAGVGALAGGAVGAYMDAQEAKLREQLAGTGVSVTRVGDDLILNMPGNVTFDVDRYDVRSNFYPVLNSVGLVLEEFDKTLIDVVGHTDSTGALDYNMELSEKRARSVGDYLIGQGVVGARILAQGMGPRYPVASNTTSDGRQLNRRVELVLRPITA
jgi:outer membrane protein OmpA-like peptidoglycan-associated protein